MVHRRNGGYTVTGRDGDALTLKEAHDEIDGSHICKGTSVYEIHEEDGQEYIVMGSYLGCENRIYAGEQISPPNSTQLV